LLEALGEPQLCVASFSQLEFSCPQSLSQITTVGTSFLPQKSEFLCPTDWKKGGTDILLLLLPFSLHQLNLIIFSLLLVSFRVVVISAWSWPSHRSFVFSASDCPSLSRHAVKYTVVMILVSSTRSSHVSDESWILTKPPAAISWSRNQVFSLISGVSLSGSKQVKIVCSRWYWGRFPLHISTHELWICFCRLGCWLLMDDEMSFAPRARFLYSVQWCSATRSMTERASNLTNGRPKPRRRNDVVSSHTTFHTFHSTFCHGPRHIGLIIIATRGKRGQSYTPMHTREHISSYVLIHML